MTEPLYDCPYCDGRLAPLPTHPDLACNLCGRRFEAEMIIAYKEAEEAFIEAHRNLATMAKRRIEPRRDLIETETKDLFRYAYSSLREATRHRMPETYRMAAIEMLAEISRFFSERGMTSRYEAGYWYRLLIEMDDDRVIGEIDARLQRPPRGPFDRLGRWLARLDRRRRIKRLRLMDEQIAEIEQVIAFVDQPHVRKRSRYLG